MYEEPGAEGDDGNLYVHHDVMLPAFPLAVAWLDCDPAARRQRANLAAVGERGGSVWPKRANLTLTQNV